MHGRMSCASCGESVESGEAAKPQRQALIRLSHVPMRSVFVSRQLRLRSTAALTALPAISLIPLAPLRGRLSSLRNR